MSDILASVSVVLGAEISGFRAAMADARKELRGLVQFAEGMKDIGQSLTQYVSLPIAAFGAAAVVASGKVESLRKGLEAITLQQLGQQGVTGLNAMSQAAEQTTERLAQLREIAKTPGLGFEGAVQADVRLRAVGISAEQSAKSIKAFANAIATTGGGKDEFNRVTVQLAQLSAKGKVLAQDLRPIIEAAPAVAAALQRLYGTVDSETISESLAKQGKSSKDFVGILTDELAKLPAVEGGLKNAFENLADNTTLALAKIGDGISKALNIPGVVASLSASLDSLAQGFAGLSPAAQTAVVGLAGLVAATGPVLVALGTLGAALPAIRAGMVEVRAAVVLLQNSMGSLRAAAAAVLSPMGAIIAVAVTLGAVIYAASTESERAYESFHKQAEATRQLDSSLSPLLDRYDELKSKTSLSAAEQEELRAVVQKVTAIMPEAGTKIDQYGNFIDIAASKARQSVAAFKEIDKSIALASLPQARQELKELQGAYAEAQQRAQDYNRASQERGESGSFRAQQLGYLRESITQVGEELEKQRAKVKDFEQAAGQLAGTLAGGLKPALTETQLALKFLGGQGEQAAGLLAGLHEQLKQLKQEQQDAPTEKLALAYNPLIKNLQEYISKLEGSDKASRKAADAIAKLRSELAALSQLDDIIARPADGFDTVNRRVKTLESGLKTLLEAGVSPNAKAFKAFAAEALTLQQSLDKLQASTALNFKVLTQVKVAPVTIGEMYPHLVGTISKELADRPLAVPFKLMPLRLDDTFSTLTELNKSLAQIGTSSAAFGADFDFLGARVESVKGALQKMIADGVGPLNPAFQNTLALFKEVTKEAERTKLATAALTSGLSAIGQAIGSSLASGADALQAVLAGLLGALGDFAVKYGETVLLKGAADIALGNVGQGTLELGAGTALIAGGSALKAFGGSVGSSPTSSAPASASNYGQNSKPQTIKIEVSEFRLRGQDLVAVARGQGYRVKLTG